MKTDEYDCSFAVVEASQRVRAWTMSRTTVAKRYEPRTTDGRTDLAWSSVERSTMHNAAAKRRAEAAIAVAVAGNG